MRKKIQEILDQEPNTERAAFLIMEFLGDELDLQGNGWFDDDPELIGWISADKEPK